MKFYIKQHVFTWGDRFSIYDEQGTERYYVQGEVFSWGKKLHLYNIAGQEVAFIRRQLFTFRSRYTVEIAGREVAEVVRLIRFFRPEYQVLGFGWNVEGDFFAHEYSFTKGGQVVAAVSKQWFTWGDAYELFVASPEDELNALAVMLAIDACVAES